MRYVIGNADEGVVSKAPDTLKKATGNGLAPLKDAEGGTAGGTFDFWGDLTLRSNSAVFGTTTGLQDIYDANTPSGSGNNTTTGEAEYHIANVGNVGTTGKAWFKMEYVPFGKLEEAAWADSTDFHTQVAPTKLPVWVIRNGLDDTDGAIDYAVVAAGGVAAQTAAGLYEDNNPYPLLALSGTDADALDTALTAVNVPASSYGTYTVKLGVPPTVPVYPDKIVLGSGSAAYPDIKWTALVIDGAAGAAFTLPLVADLWTLNDGDTVRYENTVAFDFNGGSSVPGGYTGVACVGAVGNPLVYPLEASFEKTNHAFLGWYDTEFPSYISGIALDQDVPEIAAEVPQGAVLGAGKTIYAAWRRGNYAFTGSVEPFIAPEDGTYRLEVWGASGGSPAYGGKGGYSYGDLQLTAGDPLYVAVGQQGAVSDTVGSFNGGGRAGGATYASSGGGATHIARLTGELKTLVGSQNSIFIVAGGGGGAAHQANYGARGGAGGGIAGLAGAGAANHMGQGGTGIAGGTKGTGGWGIGTDGLFGQGGSYATGSQPAYCNDGGGGSGISNFTTAGGTETGHSGDGHARITKLPD